MPVISADRVNKMHNSLQPISLFIVFVMFVISLLSLFIFCESAGASKLCQLCMHSCRVNATNCDCVCVRDPEMHFQGHNNSHVWIRSLVTVLRHSTKSIFIFAPLHLYTNRCCAYSECTGDCDCNCECCGTERRERGGPTCNVNTLLLRSTAEYILMCALEMQWKLTNAMPNNWVSCLKGYLLLYVQRQRLKVTAH